MTIGTEQYEIVDIKEYPLADSFVVNDNKIGKGSGEAKLYVGNDSKELRDFYGENIVLKCIVLKSDFIDYLNELEAEYKEPSQEYRKTDEMPTLWRDRLIKVNKLSDVVEFELNEQTQIEKPRVYFKSSDEVYSLIREISLPNFTNLQIYKLKDKNSSDFFYFKVVSTIEKQANNHQNEEVFKGKRDFQKNIVEYKNKIFFIENKELGLNINTVFDWGVINSNSMNLAQAILLEISHDINAIFSYYDDFLREYLLELGDEWTLNIQAIKVWLEQKQKLDVLELDNITENYLESIYPYEFDIENDELDIREVPFTVKEIVTKMLEGKLITDPDFQRNLVWKKDQKSQFIESILLNIPLPPIYLNQGKDGRYIIVDGLQRSTTLKEFLQLNTIDDDLSGNGFGLNSLRALPLLNGKQCNQLSDNLQTRLRDKKINCYIIKPNVPMRVVYDIFNRINTGGTVLTRQEIRNCIYIGPSTILLTYLSGMEYFKKAIDYGVSDKRMKDREVILRYLAFQIFDYKQYDGDMDEFLGKTMMYINALGRNDLIDFKTQDIFLRKDEEEYKTNINQKLINIEKIRSLVDNFQKVMELSSRFFGKNNFRFPTKYSRGTINIAILESVGYFFAVHNKNFLINNQTQIVKNFSKLLDDNAYEDAVRFSTGDKKRVVTRFERAIDILGEGIC